MDKPYLLTYSMDGSIPTYAWFETQDELYEFIIDNNENIVVFEKYFISDAYDLDTSE